MSNKEVDILRKKMAAKDIDAFIVTNKANRYYLSGFTGTYGQVLIAKNDKFVIADGRYFEQLKTQSPDFEVRDNKMRMIETICELIREKKYRRIGFESNEMNVTEYLGLQGENTSLIPTQNWIENIRKIKNENEIHKIQDAANIADRTFEHVLDYIKPGMTEKQVANEIDQFGLSLGADAPAFETIVASGKRSSLPHGHASSKTIEQNEMIILDFGFLKDKYYSDITRTFALGEVSNELKDIYQITLTAQKKAIESCKSGIQLKEIDEAARKFITDQGYGEKFLHGTGHGLGLTVHEYPLLNQESDSQLEEGMVFTVEPGIYLENVGGIRIEDDVMIDKKGNCKLLTHSNKDLLII